MRALAFVVAACVAATGCSRTGGAGDGSPVERMFDAPYEKFLFEAGAHQGACEISITAKGNAGTQSDGTDTSIEVDAEGNYRLSRETSFEMVRVGNLLWQRAGSSAKWEAIEGGARGDLVRDDAIAGWRTVLAPLRDRITLKKTGTRTAGGRTIEEFDIVVEAGGGADGGVQALDGKGNVGLDQETGFPVSFAFEGSWEGPAMAPADGRVTWTADKLACAITEWGAVEAVTPAIAAPTPAAPEATGSPTPAAPAKPAATKKPSRR